MFRFDHWAQPVTSRPWALAAVILHRVMRATRYRRLGHATHRAWERACGIYPYSPEQLAELRRG